MSFERTDFDELQWLAGRRSVSMARLRRRVNAWFLRQIHSGLERPLPPDEDIWPKL